MVDNKIHRSVETERAHFRLLNMECCHILICWVNPRFPNYCPECGKFVYPGVKEWVVTEDMGALIKHHVLVD